MDKQESATLSLFSGLSGEFDARYSQDANFIERAVRWKALIDLYVGPGTRVYDLGCGPGHFSFYAAGKGAIVTALDGAAGMIQQGELKLSAHPEREHLHIRFLKEALPLKSPERFAQGDVVLCSSVFEYIADRESMVQTFRKLLKPGGILILSVPNRQSVYRVAEKAAFRLTGKPAYLAHVHQQLSRQELETFFSGHGFRMLSSGYFASRYPLSPLIRMLMGEQRTGNLLLAALELTG
jgi:2-polyprenyl-3-methyl-5-hydroxy-6-metoxy-1,4-benzoquinol methylase